jgi:hypothetical protein
MTTFSLALASMGPAHAAAYMPISEAVEAGTETIILVEALDSRCETFSIDEDYNLSSTYRTTVSITAVLSEGTIEEEGQEVIVAGESIEIRWDSFTEGPYTDSDVMGCTEPSFSISEGAQRPLVIEWSGDAWTVNPWYEDDSTTSIEGSGVFPECGQAQQTDLLSDEHGDPIEDIPMGCSATALPAAGPLLALGALCGLLRRREKSQR